MEFQKEKNAILDHFAQLLLLNSYIKDEELKQFFSILDNPSDYILNCCLYLSKLTQCYIPYGHNTLNHEQIRGYVIDTKSQQYQVVKPIKEIDKYCVREIVLQSFIYHPFITELNSFSLTERNILTVMSPFSSIEELLKQKDFLLLTDILKMAKQAYEGLMYLRSLNILHRDIKPQNLFVDQNLNLLIGDLGLSRPGKDFKKHDQNNTVAGTPLYMSKSLLKRHLNHDKTIEMNDKFDSSSFCTSIVRILSDQFPYSHCTGQIKTKEDYLKFYPYPVEKPKQGQTEKQFMSIYHFVNQFGLKKFWDEECELTEISTLIDKMIKYCEDKSQSGAYQKGDILMDLYDKEMKKKDKVDFTKVRRVKQLDKEDMRHVVFNGPAIFKKLKERKKESSSFSFQNHIFQEVQPCVLPHEYIEPMEEPREYPTTPNSKLENLRLNKITAYATTLCEKIENEDGEYRDIIYKSSPTYIGRYFITKECVKAVSYRYSSSEIDNQNCEKVPSVIPEFNTCVGIKEILSCDMIVVDQGQEFIVIRKGTPLPATGRHVTRSSSFSLFFDDIKLKEFTDKNVGVMMTITVFFNNTYKVEEVRFRDEINAHK